MGGMRHNVTVDVPYSKNLPYTLFSKGSQIELPSVDKTKEFVHFKYGGGTVFALFYTFTTVGRKRVRRAYVATGWNDEKDGEPSSLPGVEEPLYILFKARGREVDRLKRVLYVLVDEQDDEHKAFKLPLLFWHRLCALIRQSQAARSDVRILWEHFAKKKLLRLTKKERMARRAK
jgi:hypothetical protein